MSANAAVGGDFLGFDEGSVNVVTTVILGTTYTSTTVSGSYFSMDANGDGSVAISEMTVIGNINGLYLSDAASGEILQAASGSHSGAPDGSESPDIDNPWNFFGNTGMHQTTSGAWILSDAGLATGNTMEIDFTGWDVTWNGIASIPMGGDTANFASDTGIANITCAADCSVGDTYVLEYAAHVPLNDASGFGGVAYGLYLEGTVGVLSPYTPISTVPVPAAVWLFGSGLLGLVGVARRKKTA
ncbi:MAG TPA: VPLPA-CTERM sorting domain-containing protein [Gammaproteobacteria bacterium]|nr:VPLPA-CTERM sorting domain-containing protein [Gammaproteobacteria bacterium]